MQITRSLRRWRQFPRICSRNDSMAFTICILNYATIGAATASLALLIDYNQTTNGTTNTSKMSTSPTTAKTRVSSIPKVALQFYTIVVVGGRYSSSSSSSLTRNDNRTALLASTRGSIEPSRFIVVVCVPCRWLGKRLLIVCYVWLLKARRQVISDQSITGRRTEPRQVELKGSRIKGGNYYIES